jgi:glucokinase
MFAQQAGLQGARPQVETIVGASTGGDLKDAAPPSINSEDPTKDLNALSHDKSGSYSVPLRGATSPHHARTQAGTQRITGKLLATQGYVVGIEISGSGARQSVALADLNGTILHRIRRPLEYVPDTRAVLELIDEMLAEVMDPQRLQDGRVLRVGVAVGGLVDATRGVVRTLHHAHGWDNFPLQDYLTERLNIPCIIDNNANAAALAEVLYGVGTSERIVLYIGLGRGIGGGLVINGKIYHGTTCSAGEIGHLLVKENGPKCSCGKFGHLEAIASAQAISRTMIGLSAEYPETEAAIHRITGARAERITAEQVFQLAATGDPIAQHIVDDMFTYLGIALANIIHLMNPGMIILGGQVTQAGELLLEPLQERLRDLCLPVASEDVRIVLGKLGTEANIVGAVTLALQDI